MGSDVPHIRYIFPRFKGNYTVFMRTLHSSCTFDASDIAQFRLKVIVFGNTHGWKATRDAFGVSRSTYFSWKKGFSDTHGRLSSLVPISTRPHRVRHMRVDPRIITFIKEVRKQYGRVGKEKLYVLLSAYCQEMGIPSIHATTIGKIIKRHTFFFEGKRPYKKRRSGVLRVRRSPRETLPGYLEMDSVIIRSAGTPHVFITAIDVVTKHAACLHATTQTASRARELLEAITTTYQFPIRVVQTDNGSEFLGAFDQYCQENRIPHLFTYPRSPRINGGIERFNRTIQEEFIERTDSLFQGKTEIATHLQKYLFWYNEVRPHQSLGYQSPSQYMQSLQSNM